MAQRPKAQNVLTTGAFEKIYRPDTQTAIAELVDFVAPRQTIDVQFDRPELLADVELIFSGWSGPRIDPAFPSIEPNL